VIVVDGIDALNFNNLVDNQRGGATNPIVKKLPMLNDLHFKFYF
jgi:hypothetical protein